MAWQVVESLEGRRLLAATISGAVLTIDGTAGDDVIELGIEGDLGTFVINGVTSQLDVSAVRQTRIFLGDGNDVAVLSVTRNADMPEATLYGGNGNDELRVIGTDTVTRLFGEAGGDFLTTDRRQTLRSSYIYGGAGDDNLYGGNGRDRIFGGAGNDVIRGGSGNDALDGGDGNDTIQGFAGLDVIRGGPGDDVVSGGNDRDLMEGGAGNDSLYGGAGDDELHGEVERFFSSEATGNDVLTGGDGDDMLRGNAGRNTLVGNDGNDTLIQVAADPGGIAYGGAGNDLINAFPTGYTAYGAGGDDAISLGDDSIAFGGSGNDELTGGNADSVDADSTQTLLGEAGNDSLIGFGGRDEITGGDGADLFFHGDFEAGNELTDFTDGFDRRDIAVDLADGLLAIRTEQDADLVRLTFPVVGGVPYVEFFVRKTPSDPNGPTDYDNAFALSRLFAIRVDQGGGDDFALFSAQAADAVPITIDAGAGNDTLEMQGDQPNITFLGGDGDDTAINAGGPFGARFFGERGNDTLTGNLGNDFLIGGPGIDVLTGNGGDDRLNGGPSPDVVTGGAGKDLFDTDEQAAGEVTDYDPAVDILG